MYDFLNHTNNNVEKFIFGIAAQGKLKILLNISPDPVTSCHARTAMKKFLIFYVNLNPIVGNAFMHSASERINPFPTIFYVITQI